MTGSDQDQPKGAVDWESLYQFISQFDGVKTHLLRAGTEVLLAAKALLDQIITTLEEENPGNRQKWEFLYAFQYSLGFMGARLDSMGGRTNSSSGSKKVSQAQKNEIKRSVLQSLVEVLNREISQVMASGEGDESELSTEDRTHLGALMAVQNVIVKEIEKIEMDSPKKKTKKSRPPTESSPDTTKKPETSTKARTPEVSP